MKLIAALLFIIASASITHADNTTDTICQQSTNFGLSPGQIADNLHSGQPSMPEFRQRGTVLNTLGDCDQP